MPNSRPIKFKWHTHDPRSCNGEWKKSNGKAKFEKRYEIDWGTFLLWKCFKVRNNKIGFFLPSVFAWNFLFFSTESIMVENAGFRYEQRKDFNRSKFIDLTKSQFYMSWFQAFTIFFVRWTRGRQEANVFVGIHLTCESWNA